MFGRCRRRPDVEPEVLVAGVRQGETFVVWGDAVRVTAWLQDLFVHDRLCIGVEGPGGEMAFSEDDAAWDALLVALRREYGIERERLHELWGTPFSTETLVLLSRADKVGE